MYIIHSHDVFMRICCDKSMETATEQGNNNKNNQTNCSGVHSIGIGDNDNNKINKNSNYNATRKNESNTVSKLWSMHMIENKRNKIEWLERSVMDGSRQRSE